MLKLKLKNKKHFFIILSLIVFSSCVSIKSIIHNNKENIGSGIIIEKFGKNEAIIYFDSKIDVFDFKLKMEAYDQISYVHATLNTTNDIVAIQKNIFYEWIDVESIIVSYYIDTKMNVPIDEDRVLNDSKSL